MPPDERKEGPGFSIVERRGSAAEEEPLAAPPLPKVDFEGLALSLATSALFYLGLVPDPQTGQPGTQNLALARHSIDTLELLEDKTRGNLTGDPYFTDGLRVVLFLSGEPVAPSEVQFQDWRTVQ